MAVTLLFADSAAQRTTFPAVSDCVKATPASYGNVAHKSEPGWRILSLETSKPPRLTLRVRVISVSSPNGPSQRTRTGKSKSTRGRRRRSRGDETFGALDGRNTGAPGFGIAN